MRVPSLESARSYYQEFMYDELLDDYYERSDFHNFGYWTASTRSARAACTELLDRLAASLPADAERVLDVACGKGATTRHLQRALPAAHVTGVDVSTTQLATCRSNCPGCTFSLNDACMLGFRTGTFDAVVCVEAAFHFSSRQNFLSEAHRVLAPGGVLAMQDIVHRGAGTPANNGFLPARERLRGPSDYETLLGECGFAACTVIDATVESAHGFYTDFLRYLDDDDTRQRFDLERIRLMRLGAKLFERQLDFCVLVYARATA